MPNSNEPQASLIEVLTALRKGAGLTQSQLASRLGKPQSFIAKIEGGERRVEVIEFYAIARALGVPPAEAFADLAAALPERVDI